MRICSKILLLLFLQINLLIGNLYGQHDLQLYEFKQIPKTADNVSKLIALSKDLIDYKVDSALSYAHQIQQIPIPAENYELHCKISINIGTIAKISGKYDESNKYLSKSLEIAEKNHLISCKIISLCEIGDLNRCIGLLDQSLYYLYLAKNFAHQNKVNQQYPELYDRISSTFYQLTEHDQQGFKLTKIPNQNEFSLKKSKAADYMKLCKIYADSALMFSELNNDSKTKLSCLNVLGAYYRQKGIYGKAIEKFQEAVELAKKENQLTDMSNYYINIARTYFIQKKYNKAIEYGLTAFHIADNLKILVYMSTSANILRISYMELGDYKNALTYQHIEASVRAQMNSEQNWSKISELNEKYQTEQKQKEIEYQKNLLDLKNAQVLSRNIIIVGLFIACIFIFVGIIYIQRQKNVLIKQNEEIQKQYERLEKLDRFKELLTHSLVHDLKNPLSQIMLNTGNPTIQLSVRKMMRLITNMLDVEKYETTQFKLNKVPHSLYEILREIKKEHELSLKEKNLKLNLNFDDHIVNADKYVITRVLDNLLSNAIHFSHQNQNINISATFFDENTVKIDIQNFGEIIPETNLPYIFDKYVHFEKSNSSSHRSTGLGLAFCKMAIEAHGQKISVRNAEEGVVFSFTLASDKSLQQTIEKEAETPETVLTASEKNILNPYFERLKNLEPAQISDILEVLKEIPQTSENINAIKQQILHAAFTGNIILYDQVVNQ